MRFSFPSRRASHQRTKTAHRSRSRAAGLGGHFGAGLTLEPLEKRIALSVTPTLAGAAPNFVVTFVDSNTGIVDNNLELRFNAGTTDLEWAVNGGAFSNDLDPAGGTQNATFADIADIIVQMELGNDALSWTLQTFAFDAEIIPNVGNPQQTDILLDDTGSAEFVDVSVTGTDIIVFNGAGSNDMLIANSGGGDHVLRVDNFNPSLDRITSDVLPEIRFGDLDTVEVSQAGTVGTDVVTFAPLNLSGALNYQTSLRAFDTLVIEGADGWADRFTVERSAGGGVSVTDTFGDTVIEQLDSQLGLLRIDTLGSADRVTVDVDGTDLISIPIEYNGGAGADELIVRGDPTTDVDELIYTPGPAVGAGDLRYESAGNARLMSIEFANLAPVLDLVPATTLTVNATNADNAINYIQGPNSGDEDVGFALTGLVSVDGFETIEFSNKGSLVINALAGDDTINLNNPITPTGLTGIFVNAADPTASDTLIVNGRPGIANDNVRLAPTAFGEGTITNPTAPATPVTMFTGIEHLEVVLQADDADGFAVDGTPDDDHYRVTSGPEFGRMQVEGTMADGAVGGPFALPSIDVINLHDVTTSVYNAFNTGGSDTFEIIGTNENDRFDIRPNLAGGATVTHFVNEVRVNRISFNNVDFVTIEGLDGDDTFNVDADDEGFEFDLQINGNNPSASDIVNLSNAIERVFVNLGDGALAVDTTITGYGGTMTLSGIEIANLDVGNDAVVVGTASDESISYTPISNGSGRVVKEGLNTVFTFTNVFDGFTIDPGTGINDVTFNGTSNNDLINLSQSAGFAFAQVSGFQGVEMPVANLDALVIAAGLGNDELSVNSGLGPVTVPITYDGEEGTNSLRLFGGGAETDTYSVGPEVGSGVSQIEFAGGTQTVHFSNLAPVIDNVNSPVLIVNATNADNAINYTQGPSGEDADVANAGLVSVDGFEIIEFGNKEELVINALAGDDTINLNNPTTPTGLAGITVNGGDPTASDTLIVNSVPGSNEVLTMSPGGTGRGDIFSSIAVVLAQFTGIEHVSAVLQQGDIDEFVVSGTANSDNFRVNSGPEVGRLHVEGTMNLGGAQYPLPSIDIFGQSLNGNAAFNSNIGGGFDTFEFIGTDGNDNFSIVPVGANTGQVAHAGNFVGVNSVRFDNISSLAVDGGDGDDEFGVVGTDIPGDLSFQVTINGGGPSASDIVNLSDPTGAVTVNLGDAALATDTSISGYGSGDVVLSGVEIANVDAGSNDTTVVGTASDESISYTPVSNGSGKVQKAGLNTVFNFSDVFDGFRINPAGGINDVTVNGTSADDAIDLSQSGGSIVAQVTGFLGVIFPAADLEALFIAAGLGNDELIVDSTTGPVLVPITYDGEQGTNSLRLTGGVAITDTYSVGPEVGSGVSQIVFAGGTQTVHFSNLAPVIDLVVAPTLIVNGTNANNAINYTEGSVAANGLVSVDGFETIEFSNKAELVIDALAGDDKINLNNPTTPTGLLDILVNGGDPTASDTLVINGRVGVALDNIRLAPTALGNGTITNPTAPAIPPVAFEGIEHLEFVLQFDEDDLFSIDGTLGNDHFRVTSGPEIGRAHVEGTMAEGIGGGPFALPSIDVQNMLPGGSSGVWNSVTVGGDDSIEFVGTPFNDEFDISGDGGTGGIITHRVNGVFTNEFAFDNFDDVVIDGLDGDDIFNLTGAIAFDLDLNGGNPSASDIANLSGATGFVMVSLADSVLSTDTSVIGYGVATVTLSGVEVANLDTNNNALTVIGTSNDDTITYTPTGAAAGTFSNAGLNTVFNFTNVVDLFSIAGGGGNSADQVIVQGTNARDVLQIDQGARTVQVLANNVTALKTVTLDNSIEILTAAGRGGQDTFQVIPAAGVAPFPLDNLLINVDGGNGGENNALVVAASFAGATLPGTTFVVVNRGAEPDSGTVRVFQNAVANPDINYQNVQIVSPSVSGTNLDPNLLVMGPDLYEPNEFQGNAAFLGSATSIEVERASIFPNAAEFPSVPADIDFYRIVANITGILDLRIFFRTFAPGLLPGNGELTLEIRDSLGNAVGTVLPDGDSLGAVIPVVSGQSYYVRVAGVNGSVVNGYSLAADNFAAPVPTAVVLDPDDDTGQNNLDEVTFETEDVHFFVHADLAAFAADGITILTPAEAVAGVTPGAAVEVFVNGVSAGFATVLAGTDNTLFEIELDADLVNYSAGGPNAAGPAGYPGFTNLLTAAVRIFDVQEDGGGAPDPVDGRGPQSAPLEVLFDNIDPLAPSTPELLPTSDSGILGDNITSVNPPAFQGTGEANTIVRIFADGTLIGEGLVGSDNTDGVPDDGLGFWEVTVEPLTDGEYVITAQLEDIAGNIGEPSDGLLFTLDTTSPQRPTIDLLDNYDTGMSNLDNVTYFVELNFRVSAEPGSEVVIKDGNTVIDMFVMPAVDFTIRTIMWPVMGIAAEGPHPISAEATDGAGNRSHQSHELLLTIDTIPPAPPSTPELLVASDSGTIGDGITSVNPPAFKGTGEANAKVRIFAKLIGVDDAPVELVGQGMVGSDLTDPPEDLPDEIPIGAWEVTIEPLADGMYEITAELEDLAGNISEMSDAFILEIDTLAPQRPTLDLLDNFDTGMSDLDNVTMLTTLDFRVSAEPGTEVVIKDGNTVIDMFIMPAVPFTIRTLDFVALEGINGIPAEGPHPLSAEATDEADNRSHQSEELLVTIDSTAPDAATTPDLLASSDSGTFDNDDVTNIQAVAFDGTGEANAKVRIFANGLLVGQGVVGSDLTDPPTQLPDDPPAFGEWEITTEPLASGNYLITVEIEDLAGNITLQEEALEIWVDTILPNTPYLDLTEASDSGRNNQDNITNDNTPTVTSTIDDVQGAPTNAFPNDIRYRIFDRPGTGTDVLLVDSFVDIPGFSTDKFFTDVLPLLADGVHNLKLEAEDRAGNINDFLLQITIDTVAPPVFFGLSTSAIDGLDPDSDSGVQGNPPTFTDRITNVTRPELWGTAEADAIVRLAAGGANNTPLGLTVAVPLDGNFAFPDGQWNLASTVNMNDPAFFPFDGLRELLATAEDVAGNVSEPAQLDIFIDTQGPQVTNVGITDHPEFNLFGLKPDNAAQGPTPLIFSLTIDLRDLPNRVAEFLYNAIDAGVAETPGLITVQGDHNGVIAINNIIVELDTPIINQPATASIILQFAAPLPDDRFTLTVDDAIVDIAGNNLDGENNAIEPNDFPLFPSGDGQPGGDFVARFTVDSRPEIGSYAATSIYIDINGNLLYDPQGVNNDTTNRDLTFNLGIVPSLEGTVSPFNVHDGLFAGNFPGIDGRNGQEDDNEVEPANAEEGYENHFADGYDKLAAYGFDPVAGGFRWLIDTNHDGIIDPAAGDHATIQSANFQINGLPVAGNFDGDLDNGDEIGLFDGTTWYFDTNHNYVIDGGDLTVSGNLRGSPIVGDFNGDGVDDLGTWRNDQFTFNFGTQPGGIGTQPSWTGNVQATINWGLPGTADKPVAADMDQDGIDDIGLWLPERTGTLPLEGAHWEFLLSNDFAEDQRGGNQVTALDHPFSPTPLGQDISAQFGDAFALPIVGNFDPPVAQQSLPTPQAMPALLGSLPMGSHTINGEEWYSVTPLRDGTIMVEATTSEAGAGVSASLYDENYRLLGSSSASAVAQTSVSSSVSAGETYMLRLSGDNATADVTVSNQVPVSDRLDTSRDGSITPLDALRVINDLIAGGVQVTPLAATDARMYLDTNLDGMISPIDALQIFNYLLNQSPSPAAAPAAASDDSVAAPLAATADAAVAFAVALDDQSAGTASAVTPAAADSVYAELESDAATDAETTDASLLPVPAFESSDADDEGDDDLVASDLEWDWLS